MSDAKELLQEICKTYGRDIFTLKELSDILHNCEFSGVEARQILLDSFNNKHLGKVSLRKVRRMPCKTSFIAILTNCK
ncbi:hypothetical protein SAMN04488494_1019 [Xylanibacter ruminicola]|uniref:Uncharacterized protein n=1 Tax=Xylanibacter ruminicola TaxID=839 RepID=A0A1M7EBJ1_XYLRU|nr:hypothetical protein SAMN04488493_103320 [Xylanibacter ruminicola]SHL88978.1 hypothetical protein SAMN04488494_1019 [Xylanibacter ruminicola]